MPEFADIARLALSHSLQICQELFPLGTRNGREFIVGDIYGNKGESLSINIQTGIWKDFSSSMEKGGDITSLVAAAKNITQGDAAEWIEEKFGSANVSTFPEKQKEEFLPIFPCPEPKDENFKHPSLGYPTDTWEYLSRDKKTLNFICRFEPKSYRALTYGKLNGKNGWYWKQLPSPRPLYNLDMLPDSGSIVIVEGEKAAEALRVKMPKQCVMTWPGGAEGVNQVDWKPLQSKKYDVLLWPDNDAPGHKAMRNVATILKGKVSSMGMLDVSGLPEKSDAADFTGNIENFVLKNRKAIKFPSVSVISNEEISSKKDVLNFDPLNLPGLIGDTVRWIISISDQPRVDIALFNTLAFAGAVFGRRYESPRRTRTNIYIVATADTAAGKNFSRQAITRLSSETDLITYLGGNSIRSDTGMLRGLANNGSQLLMLDEFGQFLRALHDPKMVHHRNIMRTFLTLYSDSNSVYNHGDYADPKAKTIVIHYPNLCIYGTTTESEYIPALKKSSIESGELNRFIVLPMDSSKKYPLKETPIQDIPSDLIERWKIFSPKNAKTLGEAANSGSVVPTPIVIPWGECESIKYKLECEKEDVRCSNLPTKALYGRLPENIIKIAMIMAIGRDPHNPVFTPEDFQIGESLVRSSIHYMETLAQYHMADTDYEALLHEMLNYIKKHSNNQDNGVDKTAITRRFQRFDTRKREDVLRTLLEQESIEVVKQLQESGRPRMIYKAK